MESKLGLCTTCANYGGCNVSVVKDKNSEVSFCMKYAADNGEWCGVHFGVFCMSPEEEQVQLVYE